MRRALSPGNRQLVPQNGRAVKLYYDRPLGLDEPWEDERCGTYGGWNGHKALGEKPCEPCLAAQREYMRQWRIRTGKTRHVVSVTELHRQEALALVVACV